MLSEIEKYKLSLQDKSEDRKKRLAEIEERRKLQAKKDAENAIIEKRRKDAEAYNTQQMAKYRMENNVGV
jgi:hypothetical protein